MKNIILSSAIALITLSSVQSATAQKPHFNKKDGSHAEAKLIPQGSNTVVELCSYGVVYGLGNETEVDCYLEYEGGSISSTCANPGNNDNVPGQANNTGRSEVFTLPVTNGHTSIDDLCLTQSSSCPNGQWTSTVTSATFARVYIVIAGTRLLLSRNVSAD